MNAEQRLTMQELTMTDRKTKSQTLQDLTMTNQTAGADVASCDVVQVTEMLSIVLNVVK